MPATIILAADREKSLLRKHPWVFAGAVAKIKGRCQLGDTVDVVSAKGQWLGRGAYSPHSQIRVRIWTFNQSESVDNAFFCRRLEQAQTQRQHVIETSQTNAYRLIAGESDGLPGVTIDVYKNVVVLQLLSAGAEKHKDKIVWAVKRFYPEAIIHERSDVAVREKEGLAQRVETLSGTLPDEVVIEENGVSIIVDLINGHKTGFYLDQRDNRHVTAGYCKDRHVLNCFSYTGTFGCYALKYGAAHVTHVDVSPSALETAKRNAQLNGFSDAENDFVQQDVFQLLRDYHSQQRQFDTVILDPPKFVDSKASLSRASRGYKDINLYGIHAVKPGGYLATYSCSGLMPADLFQKIVSDAALDANRELKILQRLSQAPDHATSGNYPEGYYLKGLLCQVF
ncbi:class I SAM-dependent rRNA methyltransferase [Alteromonas facilis]|uniref:class I SAM-dependent rRNA methyltransferase n=1 Tax=Alteromonas facilis TaxID=2048004 RepID=UPI000C28D604|nr:class I SAM-dependent methyltransferase [Alteromonas facilis]